MFDRVKRWLFGENVAIDADILDWVEQVQYHFETCQCPNRGAMVGGLIGKCEPHVGNRECRWHAHTYHRPMFGEYEQGPG